MGIAYAPSIQRPRSTTRHRSEQKGKQGQSLIAWSSKVLEQIGQRPLIIYEVPLVDALGSLLGVDDSDDLVELSDDLDEESDGLSASARFL